MVATRCFGWGVRQTSMIPLADGLNHAPVEVNNFLFHKSRHLACNGPEDPYYQRCKFDTNVSAAYDPGELSENHAAIVAGHEY